jgi:seryl-tRNA synthetase
MRQSPSSSLAGRVSSGGASLDVNLIASNTELVNSHLRSRKTDTKLVEDVDRIVSLRVERNKLIVEGDAAKSQRNSLSQQIGMLMKQKQLDQVDALKRQVEDASRIFADADEKLAAVDADIDRLFSVIPNLLDDGVPDGVDDSQNIIVHSWGDDMRKMGEGYLWHDEIATKLGGLDMEAASRISGARFSVLLGQLAKLERAMIQYFLDFQCERGYTEVSVPYIVSRSTLEGTGQLPKFEDDLFKVSHSVAGEDAFLIPTAEVPVTNLYRDQLLNSTQLPIKHVCHSPSFRAEAGSYGRDTRGLLRQHQFHKVELVKICTAETSAAEHESMVRDAEALLESLELPYRRVLLCSGDVGFSARICYDLEVWLPGQQMYREISSVSNCYDFQARRMSLRYRVPVSAADKKAGKKTTAYPHTLNGSGVAVGRALVAILENYQMPDGTVRIPEKLRPYLNNKEFLTSEKQ